MSNIEFRKVSYKQFQSDYLKLFPNTSEDKILDSYLHIILPKRSTAKAAGYDFCSPVDFVLTKENDLVTIPTGIQIIMPSDTVLLLVPRSGLGFKTGMHLANTIGVIDADYIEAPNEGHIMAKLQYDYNDVIIHKGERFMQGIFIKYEVATETALPNAPRLGGLGSTGK